MGNRVAYDGSGITVKHSYGLKNYPFRKAAELPRDFIVSSTGEDPEVTEIGKVPAVTLIDPNDKSISHEVNGLNVNLESFDLIKEK